MNQPTQSAELLKALDSGPVKNLLGSSPSGFEMRRTNACRKVTSAPSATAGRNLRCTI
jgi:hypothetical protein